MSAMSDKLQFVAGYRKGRDPSPSTN